jgi:DNA-binding GntR family transcriptional regulator
MGDEMNASALAYEALKSAVLTGELLPHQKLSEPYFCEKLSISRTPLRRAVERLTAEGWFETAPNRSVKVAAVSDAEIVELYTLRALLEAATVEVAAKRCTPADIERLRYILSAQELAATADNEAEVSRLGQEFHATIWKIAGNNLFFEFLTILQERMTRYRHLSARQPGRPIEATDEHAKILKAMEARDAKKASEHLRRHIEQGKGSAVSAFRQYETSMAGDQVGSGRKKTKSRARRR